LSVVLYGCETWSLTIKEKYRLSAFENKGLGRYLDLRDEVRGAVWWRRLDSVKLYALYSPNIIEVKKSRGLR
jgi:hypothetical protein